LWSKASESLESATPGNLLHHSLIELFLLKSWYRSIQHKSPSERHSYYLDTEAMEKVTKETLLSEIHKTLLLPPHIAIPIKPVLFFPLPSPPSSSRRLVLFDYQRYKVLVFGRGRLFETNMHSDWQEWNGNHYWNAIAQEFGWTAGIGSEEQQPQVIEPNWIRV
jgi:hypothetical protein